MLKLSQSVSSFLSVSLDLFRPLDTVPRPTHKCTQTTNDLSYLFNLKAYLYNVNIVSNHSKQSIFPSFFSSLNSPVTVSPVPSSPVLHPSQYPFLPDHHLSILPSQSLCTVTWSTPSTPATPKTKSWRTSSKTPTRTGAMATPIPATSTKWTGRRKGKTTPIRRGRPPSCGHPRLAGHSQNQV